MQSINYYDVDECVVSKKFKEDYYKPYLVFSSVLNLCFMKTS